MSAGMDKAEHAPLSGSEVAKVESALFLLTTLVGIADPQTVGFLADLCTQYAQGPHRVRILPLRDSGIPVEAAARVARGDAAFQAFMARAAEKPRRRRRGQASRV